MRKIVKKLRVRLLLLVALALLPTAGLIAYATNEENWVLWRDGLILMSIGCSVFVAIWIGANVLVLRRVRVLLATAKRLSSGDLTARTGLRDDGGELGELSRAFDEMAESVARLTRRNELILSWAGDGICGIDVDGAIRFINPAAANMLGYEPSELIDRSIAAILLPVPQIGEPEASPGWSRICAIPKEGPPYRTVEEVLWRKDRTPILVEYLSTPIREADHVDGVVVVFRDITERRKTEAALRTVADNMPIVVFALDQDGVFTYLMGKGLETVGLKPDEAVGRSIFDLYRDNPSVIEHARRALAGEEYVAFIERDGGEQIWEIRWTTLRASTASGLLTGVIGMAIDVTERKRAEAQITRALKEKEVLLKEIHHRVKNNLQLISSMLHLQHEHGDASAESTVPELLVESQNRIRSMALIHETLYRSDNLTQIDFSAYVRSLTAHLFHSFGGSSLPITLTIEADEILLGVDTAIPCGLMLNELVSNALKHAFPDGRSGTVLVGVRPDAHDSHRMILSVGDTGVGLPGGLDIRRTESLGLQLVSALADQLGGVLTCRSRPGAGTELEFVFAVEEVVQQAA